jgi:Zn-dependent protease
MFGGGGGLTLLRVRGIRIGVDWSWFLVLFLVIFWLSDFYRGILDAPNEAIAPYLLALSSALLFFASILLHELGHALVAIRNGIGIAGINLWMFGGVARMERDSDSPGTEFKIAIAGPLVTVAIVAVCVGAGIAFAGSGEFWEAMRVQEDANTSGVLAMVAWLASINFLVLVFNLIPAFPMDGGRIARAIAWWRTGNRNSATRFAAGLGQAFAYMFIALGAFLFISVDPFSGLWLAVIGLILSSAARGAAIQTALSTRIEGLRVSDVMDRDPVAIPEGLSVERALDEYFLRYRWAWFPVVDAAQRFKGLLERSAADQVPEARRGSAKVAELTEADDTAGLQVDEGAPLETILANRQLRKLGALMAVDSDGRLRGVITLDQVGRAVKGALSGSA